MALSGITSKQYSSKSSYWAWVEWSATQDVASNTSTVTAITYAGTNSYGYYTGTNNGSSVTVNSATTTVGNSGSVSANTTKRELCRRTEIVEHNADGTKSITISGRWWYSGSISFNLLPSGTFTLDTIPRATQPTLSSSSTAIDSAVTINTPRASTSFTHTLLYAFGTATGTIASGVTTSQSWTLPLALANQIPSTVSGTGTITCHTYNGATLIGTRTVGFTATVPLSSGTTSFEPTASLSVNGVSLYSGYYVQGKSKVAVTVNAAGAFSSTITSRVTTVKSGNNTITSSASASFTSGTLNYSGTITIVTTVTDSRGRTATASSTVSVTAYSNPAITAFNAFRSNADGTANPQGGYIRITGSASISSIGSTNTKTTILRYRVSGTTTWSNATTNTSSYTPSLASTVSADANNSYEVQIYTADYYTNSIQDRDIGTAFVLMDFKGNGLGVAFGKVAELDAVELGTPLYFNGRKGMNTDGSIYVEDGRYMSGSDGSGTYYPTPANLPQNSVTSIFSYFDDGLAWRSGIFVKGWSGSYSAWRLSGPATTTADDNFYLQAGVGTTWRTKCLIWHSGNITPVSTSLTLTAGNGLSGGGTLAANRTFTLGTPGTITNTSINSVSTASHTHATNFDTVDSSGSNANGSWIRFTNGTQICWNSQNHGSVAVTLAWGTLYGRPLSLNNFPVAFNVVPTVTIDMRSSSNSIISSLNSTVVTTTNPGGVEPARATSATVSNLTTHYVAIGTWK